MSRERLEAERDAANYAAAHASRAELVQRARADRAEAELEALRERARHFADEVAEVALSVLQANEKTRADAIRLEAAIVALRSALADPYEGPSEVR